MTSSHKALAQNIQNKGKLLVKHKVIYELCLLDNSIACKLFIELCMDKVFSYERRSRNIVW